jgi:hypothetical protein
MSWPFHACACFFFCLRESNFDRQLPQFAEIEPILKARPNISHIHVITDAFVPVVKFNCNGVEMDRKTQPSKNNHNTHGLQNRHLMHLRGGQFGLVCSHLA